MWRFLDKPETSGTKLAAFPDASSVSDWAADGMAWAVNAGVIVGNDDGLLASQDNAIRAEVATMFMRFCESFKR